jgi:hypothetical protein
VCRTVSWWRECGPCRCSPCVDGLDYTNHQYHQNTHTHMCGNRMCGTYLPTAPQNQQQRLHTHHTPQQPNNGRVGILGSCFVGGDDGFEVYRGVCVCRRWWGGWTISILSILEDLNRWVYIYISLAQMSSYSTTLVMGTSHGSHQENGGRRFWYHHVVCGVTRDRLHYHHIPTTHCKPPTTMCPSPPHVPPHMDYFQFVPMIGCVMDTTTTTTIRTYSLPPMHTPTERLVHMMDIPQQQLPPGTNPTRLFSYPPEVVVGGHYDNTRVDRMVPVHPPLVHHHNFLAATLARFLCHGGQQPLIRPPQHADRKNEWSVFGPAPSIDWWVG